MTIVIDSDQASAERVTAYLYKLVNVLQVEDLGAVPAVARDLALVKVAVAGHDRAALLRVVDETRAHIVDTGEQTMTLEITGEPPHVDCRDQPPRATRHHRDGANRPGGDATGRHGAVGGAISIELAIQELTDLTNLRIDECRTVDPRLRIENFDPIRQSVNS